MTQETKLFGQPFLALLDVLVEKQSHVANDESENNFRKEFRGVSEFVLDVVFQLEREGGI